MYLIIKVLLIFCLIYFVLCKILKISKSSYKLSKNAFWNGITFVYSQDEDVVWNGIDIRDIKEIE